MAGIDLYKLAKKEGIDMNAPMPKDNRPIAARKKGIDLYKLAKEEGIHIGAPQKKNLFEKISDVPWSFAGGIAQNFLDLLAGAANIARKVDMPSQLTGMLPDFPKIGHVTAPDIVRHVADPTVAKVGEFFDPALYMAPELEAGGLIGRGVESLAPKVLEKTPALLSKLLGKAATGAATGGFYGAALTPGSQKRGAEFGAGTGAFLGSLLGAPGAAVSSLLEKTAAKSQLPGSIVRTPEEVEQITKMLTPEGARRPSLRMPFSDIANIPKTSRAYHGVLGKIWGSGAKKVGEDILRAARSQANKVMRQLNPNIDQSKIDQEILINLKNNYKQMREESTQQYNKLYENAEKSGIKIVEPTNLKKIALDKISEYDDEEGKALIGNEVQNFLKWGSEKEPLPFKKARKLRERYGKISFKYTDAGEKEKASVMQALQEAIDKDIENKIIFSKNKDLIDEMNEVKAFNKNNVQPYGTSEMRTLRYRTVDPDNIDKILLKGQNFKVLRHMTPRQKNLVAYKKFMKSLAASNEDADPFKLIRFYDKALSKKQREVLFGNQNIKNEFDKLRVLTTAAKEPSLQETTPPTGMRNLGAAITGLMAFLGGGAAFSPTERIPLALGLGATIGTARGLSKALTSDWLRNAYIKGELPKLLGMVQPSVLHAGARPISSTLTKLLSMGAAPTLEESKRLQEQQQWQ
jgi:hypothetical protein